MDKLARVRDWVQHCPANDVLVYHRGPVDDPRDAKLFSYMRKLSDGGLVFLFQRRQAANTWEWCAKRSRPKDHAVLDRVSETVQGPPVKTEDA